MGAESDRWRADGVLGSPSTSSLPADVRLENIKCAWDSPQAGQDIHYRSAAVVALTAADHRGIWALKALGWPLDIAPLSIQH
ncbi:hypothetical protein E2C01_084901 [Portunus trituberculatus]|uniref:Uncharacterized protein n=1 Tax=Portunus trituberculatus TaxID=210409 RepID=A0A5B7J8Z8_PORTR|nr:hypothetical protein [Portunus trituberculatus]